VEDSWTTSPLSVVVEIDGLGRIENRMVSEG
jgi:hypothetical protein